MAYIVKSTEQVEQKIYFKIQYFLFNLFYVLFIDNL